MDEPIIEISLITRDAHQAAEANEPVSVCPFPDEWTVADRWRRAYHAKSMELLSLTTT